MKKVRLDIIGVGSQRGFYADLIVEGKIENMDLGAMCSSRPEQEILCKEKYPNVAFYSNYYEMLERGNVDAVITCSSHYTRPVIGISVLKRDIHLLVEKPAGVYAKQVKE